MQSLWMLVAGLCFALMGVCVKLAGSTFSAAELVFWRSFTSVVATAALLWRAGLAIRTTRFGMHTHRGVSGFVSLFMFFYALTKLPVATAMTLNYTSPLFVALLFPLLSRQRIGAALGGAVAVGFAGAMLLLQPTVAQDQWWPATVGLASGALAAVAYWNVRNLVQLGEPEERVVFYFALYCTLGAVVWMLPERWHWPDAHTAWPIAGVALFGTAGQIFMTRAYGKGGAIVSAALSYSGIVFSSLLGFVVFDDALPWIAWLGIALIIVAGIIAVRLRPDAGQGPEPQITND